MITVAADDGSRTVEATAAFVRAPGQLLRVQRGLLTLLGAASVAVGAFRPWLDSDGTGLLLTVPRAIASLDVVIGTLRAGGVSDIAGLVVDLQPLQRFLILMMALSIAFGLTEADGERTRAMAFVVAVVSGATAASYWVTGFHLADGILLVLLGSFVGFIGGTRVRR